MQCGFGRMIAGCVLLASGMAIADDAAVLRCRAIEDAKARLACYDAVAAAIGNRMPAAAAPAGVPPAAAPAGTARTSPSPAPVTSATIIPAPAAPAPMPRQSADAFGMENRPTVEQLGEIESHIPGKFEGWRPNSRITLANGQVWQVTDGSTAYLNFSNPKVVIRRGAMGAFYMDVETDKRSPRVRRVQ